ILPAPGSVPGRCCRSEAGAIPALSRNCDAPTGDEPGRLRYAEPAALEGRAVSTAPAGEPFLFPSEKRGGPGVEIEGHAVPNDPFGCGVDRGLWGCWRNRCGEPKFVSPRVEYCERQGNDPAPAVANRFVVGARHWAAGPARGW